MDSTQYKVGYGISVFIDGHPVRVGSRRFIELKGLQLTPEVEMTLDGSRLGTARNAEHGALADEAGPP
jgi:hypothetical protein